MSSPIAVVPACTRRLFEQLDDVTLVIIIAYTELHGRTDEMNLGLAAWAERVLFTRYPRGN